MFCLHYKENAVQQVNQLNDDLEKLSKWCIQHSLKLNTSKSSAMLCGPVKLRDALNNTFNIFVNGDNLELQRRVKNLGIIMDDALSFSEHVSMICKKCYGTLKYLYRVQCILPTNLKLQLCESLILPIMDYCISLYGPLLTNLDMYRLQKILNNCIRYSFHLRKFDHISEYFKSVKWLNVASRIKYYLLLTLHKIILTDTPKYLSDKIKLRSDVHDRITRHCNMIDIPIHCTSKFENSFSYLSSWYNDLPNNFKNMSVIGFKSALKQHLLNTQ